MDDDERPLSIQEVTRYRLLSADVVITTTAGRTGDPVKVEFHCTDIATDTEEFEVYTVPRAKIADLVDLYIRGLDSRSVIHRRMKKWYRRIVTLADIAGVDPNEIAWLETVITREIVNLPPPVNLIEISKK